MPHKGRHTATTNTYPEPMAPPSARSAAASAQHSTTFRVLARAGFVVLGVLHVFIGSIAISVAVGAGSGEADQSGALTQVAELPLGFALLWAMAIGMAALGIWQGVDAVLERDPDATSRWSKRVKNIGTAIAYFSIAATAMIFALGGRTDSEQSSEGLTHGLLATPGGVFVVVAIGLVVLGIGVGFVVSGIRRSFEKTLSLPAGRPGRFVAALGAVGYIAKGLSIGMIGVLFVVAAFAHDAEAAGGLDGALKALTELPFGAVILWFVGVGLIVYGAYCFARAKYAKL